MLKGDLAATPLVEVLRTLAAEGATGCLRVSDLDGEEASVYVKGGFIYSVAVPGRRPQLGARLVSSGALAPEGLAEALEAQRDELQGWRLGELLVHLGFVEQSVVEAFVTEQLRDGITDLLRWQDGRWRFRKNDKTREDVAPPMSIDELLAAVDEREGEWAGILQEVHAPTAVPVLSTRSTPSPEMMLDGDSWSLLCKIDGERSIAELARDCGLTLFEAGRVVVSLVQAGLVDVEETVEPALSVVTGPEALPTTVTDDDQQEPPADMAMRLAAAFSAPEEPALAESAAAAVQESVVEATTDMSEIAALVTEAVLSSPAAVGGDPRDELSASIARVSAALSDLLGTSPAQSGQDIFDLPPGLRKPAKPAPSARNKKRTAEDERRDRLRAAAAAELAAAHAEAEAGRQGDGSLADVVSLDSRRHERADEAELAAVEAERLEAERVEAERAEAERAETERVEAERVEAERAEAERAEAERVEAERAEAERAEAERVEAERAEAERAEAERVEAERAEAERAEAERVEAERAEAERAEAERVEAERLEAERAEAERAEAERAEAERVEAERAEAERAEAERLEAERLEAERVEAERLEAERVEAERLEAERVEAERVEAERAEAEREALRMLAEEQAAHEAASLEAERLQREQAAAQEAAREEADRLEAERLRQERRESAAAATALTQLSTDGRGATTPEADDEDEDEGSTPDEPDDDEPVPYSEQTDTAALLRELASLGLEDEPSQPPMRATSASRAAAAPAQKKRKGLFNR